MSRKFILITGSSLIFIGFLILAFYYGKQCAIGFDKPQNILLGTIPVLLGNWILMLAPLCKK